MDLSIQRLLPKLARCRVATDLSGVALDGARQCFGAEVAAVVFLDGTGNVRERALHRASETQFDEWDRDWRAKDPVFMTAMARAMPVHVGQLFAEEEWLKVPVYRDYGRRLRIERYMATPIFGSRGNLAGMLNLCAPAQNRAFDARAMASAAMFAGFLGATFARVSEAALPQDEGDLGVPRLAPRELQVARLAAAGRNNVEIALELGLARETVKQALRRVYVKLDVRGRAPMAAKLAALDRK